MFHSLYYLYIGSLLFYSGHDSLLDTVPPRSLVSLAESSNVRTFIVFDIINNKKNLIPPSYPLSSLPEPSSRAEEGGGRRMEGGGRKEEGEGRKEEVREEIKW